MPARTPLTKNERALKLQFGATIRQRRYRLGLTQEALAQAADMNRTYLADVEKGNRNVALLGIAQIAAALGLSLAEFYRMMERTVPPERKR